MDNLYKKYYLKLTPYLDKPTAESLAQELASRGESEVVIRRVDEAHIALKLNRDTFISVVKVGGGRFTYRDYVKQKGKDPLRLYNRDGSMNTSTEKLTFGSSDINNTTTYVINVNK